MRGFDPKFKDVPDYIYQVTRDIWEDRGVGRALADHYAPDVIVRAANALIVGNGGVAAATLQTLHEFPDRELVGEDVIWTGDDDRGWFSSHRLISVMRHLGSGPYGEADGRLVRSRIIADCVLRDNLIVEEWLVRDQAAFAYCLGTTPELLARKQVADDQAAGGEIRFFSPAVDVPGPHIAEIDSSDEARCYSEGWTRLWAGKTPSVVRELYFHGATVSIPGGETLNGHVDIDRFVLSYLAAFPDMAFSVDHLIVNRDPGQPVRVAMRWTMTATHSGWGRFGRPTGAPVFVLGISHAYVVDGRVSMEWIVTDEVAIWKQIFAHRGL